MSKKLEKLLNILIDNALNKEANWCFFYKENTINLDLNDWDISIIKKNLIKKNPEYGIEISRYPRTIYYKTYKYKSSGDNTIYDLIIYIYEYIYKTNYSLDTVIGFLLKKIDKGKLIGDPSKQISYDDNDDELPF